MKDCNRLKKNSIFFIFFFLILFEKFYCDESNREERIINTIKLMLSSIQSDIEKNLFSLDYLKYAIIFSNFRLLKPLEQDLNIIKTEEETEEVYVINGLIISFVVDLNIRFFNHDNELKDTDRFFETTFSSIKFSVKDDYIDLIESNIKEMHLSSNSKIGKLNYFRNFNIGKNCTYAEIGKDPIKIENSNDTLINIFEELFKKRFNIIKNQINLITYDAKNIFSQGRKNISCSGDSLSKYGISSFLLNKMRISIYDLEIKSKINTLTINNMLMKGIFFSQKYNSNINFNITLDSRDTITFEKNMVSINFNDPTIEFDEHNNDNNQKNSLKEVIQIEYSNYLNELRIKYYNDII